MEAFWKPGKGPHAIGLKSHVCYEGVMVNAVQNQEWSDANFEYKALKGSASKTDYLLKIAQRRRSWLKSKGLQLLISSGKCFAMCLEHRRPRCHPKVCY